MQGKFTLALGDECHHSRIMRAWAQLGEIHLISFNEKFHTVYPPAAQTIRDGFGNLFGFLERCSAHRHRLPGEDVVAIFLNVPDWFTEDCFVLCSDSKECNFIVKIDKPFNDEFAGISSGLFGYLPGVRKFAGAFGDTLTMARAAHHRFDHTWKTDTLCSFL